MSNITAPDRSLTHGLEDPTIGPEIRLFRKARQLAEQGKTGEAIKIYKTLFNCENLDIAAKAIYNTGLIAVEIGTLTKEEDNIIKNREYIRLEVQRRGSFLDEIDLDPMFLDPWEYETHFVEVADPEFVAHVQKKENLRDFAILLFSHAKAIAEGNCEDRFTLLVSFNLARLLAYCSEYEKAIKECREISNYTSLNGLLEEDKEDALDTILKAKTILLQLLFNHRDPSDPIIASEIDKLLKDIEANGYTVDVLNRDFKLRRKAHARR